MVAIIQSAGIEEKTVLDAMLKVPRHLFVDKSLEPYAYDNSPLPIGNYQTISQPYIVAYMIQQAQLTNTTKVLEIGTGSGYETAILAEICQGVFTVEIIKDLANDAASLLQELGYHNIHFKIGDGHEGWDSEAPFDAIIVTAKAESLPEKLIHQLAIGGRLIIPLQKFGRQTLVKITKISPDNNYITEELIDVRFVPLVYSPSAAHTATNLR